ncbi:hypothetical protein [Pseudonocardia sp. HH130629-09]|nr:hypothetical protein [Pseudonocardia sp. HH130629-09]
METAAALETLPDDQREVHAAGQILALTVDDLEGEPARLVEEGSPSPCR